MNRISLLLIGVGVGAIQGCAQLKPATDVVSLYTFEPPAPTQTDNSKRLLDKFLGVRDGGDLYRSDANTVHYVSKQDVSESFEYDLANENFTFNKSMSRYAGNFVPQLPDPQQSVSLAEAYLRGNDIAPRDLSQLKVVHLGGLRATAVIDGKRAGPVIDELVTVNFGRVVDGVPVIGPGSKIIVNVGDKGEIMGVIRRWRELNTATKVNFRAEEVLSLREAEALARRQILAEYGEGASYRILASGKRYYDNNGKVLQPVYSFEVTITLRDERVRPFDYLCVIPMLRDSPEPLNLTAIDPMAKRLISSARREQKAPAPERSTSD